jgi:hypothetical protein
MPKPPKQEDSTAPGAGTGGGSGGSSHTTPAIPSIEELFSQMLKQYLPETVEFTPLSEEVLSETIRNWIRPAYEQAIASRREQTDRINAELDADAWSRGMGSSTYVTDVKERQYRGEMRDVDALESDYAATLAGHLYDAMKEQQERKIEVDEFNAGEINRAREKAMEAAQALYQSYLSGSRSHGGSGRSGGTTAEEDAEAEAEGNPSVYETILKDLPKDQPKTDYRTAATVVARMSPKERARLYNKADPAYLRLRSELIYGLGRGGFAKLMQQFPA